MRPFPEHLRTHTASSVCINITLRVLWDWILAHGRNSRASENALTHLIAGHDMEHSRPGRGASALSYRPSGPPRMAGRCPHGAFHCSST